MNFQLRPWSMNDVNSLAAYANNYDIAKFMTDQFPHPYTKENAEIFIAFVTKDDPVHIFCIDVEGEAVGGIGIILQTGIHQKNAELGYWLGQPFWGRGIVTNAVKKMIVFTFENYDINRIFARPFATNDASVRVLEKAGFVLEARFDNALFKNGQYIDELVYAVRREP